MGSNISDSLQLAELEVATEVSYIDVVAEALRRNPSQKPKGDEYRRAGVLISRGVIIVRDFAVADDSRVEWIRFSVVGAKEKDYYLRYGQVYARPINTLPLPGWESITGE
jgi:hypothetical protein